MNIVDLGRRGLGKSTLAWYQATSLNAHRIVFDANNQFRHIDNTATTFKEFAEKLDKAPDDLSKEWELRYIVHAIDLRIEGEWDQIASILWRYGNYSLIIDEAQWLQKPQYINPWLNKFLRQAPRRERNDDNPIDIIQTMHRPVDMSPLLLSLVDEVNIFRVTRQLDLDYVRREFGEDVERAVANLKTPLTNPSGREYVSVQIEDETHETITDSSKWYTDIKHSKPKPRLLDRIRQFRYA